MPHSTLGRTMVHEVSTTKARRLTMKKGSAVTDGEYVDHAVLWTLDNSAKGWDSVVLQLYDPSHDEASRGEHVGDLKIDLKGVNWGQVPRTTAPDNRSLLYQFDATLRIGAADQSGLPTFKLLRNGQKVGTVDFKDRR
ncbi:hypothetical protein PG995_014217 [Apiospora arundinis]